jgi:ABC-type transport system involved in cytochrome c biogenesis permease component
LFAYPLALVLTLLLATIGIAVPGAVFATILLRSRSRQVLLPIILYPLLVPLMIAATKSTAAIAAAQPDVAIAYFWIKFLVVFDAAFILVALWFFEPLVIE